MTAPSETTNGGWTLTWDPTRRAYSVTRTGANPALYIDYHVNNISVAASNGLDNQRWRIGQYHKFVAFPVTTAANIAYSIIVDSTT